MLGRRTSSVLTLLLLLTLSISHRTPGSSASLTLRGRWSPTIDETDAAHGDSDHLRRLVRVLRDQQRRRPAAGPLDREPSVGRFPLLDREITGRLLRTFQHQADETGEANFNEQNRNAMPMSSDNDPQSAVIAPRLFGSTGNHRDSVIPDELEKSGLERYEDEIERIQDAIADSNWYASEEHVNEDDYDRPTGVLNPFRRQVESASSVKSRLHRVRRTTSRAVNARKSPPHCDQLRHLVNESCNLLPEAVETMSCQSYMMCIACNTDREDECVLRHVTPGDSPACLTSGDDVTVTCRTEAQQQVLVDVHRVLPVNVGACAEHLQCTRFRVD